MSDHKEELNQSEPKGEYRKLNEQETSQSNKYPSLFRVKIVALILIILALIFLIVDLFLLVYLLNDQPSPQDLTFVNGIITQSQLLQDSTQIQIFIRNMLKANPQTKYQYADILRRDIGTPNAEQLKEIFWDQSDNLLYLMKVGVDGGVAETIGIFIHGSFPIPKQDDFEANRTYYTFELESKISVYVDERKSIMFSLTNEVYIQYNNIIHDPLNCKIYEFEYNSFLSLLSILSMDVTVTSDSATVQLVDNSCFNGIANQTQYLEALSSILNANVRLDSSLLVDSYEIYRFYT